MSRIEIIYCGCEIQLRRYGRWCAYVFIDASLGKEFEELQLSQGSKAEECVIEGKDFLYSDLATCGFVKGCCHRSVCTLSNRM